MANILIENISSDEIGSAIILISLKSGSGPTEDIRKQLYLNPRQNTSINTTEVDSILIEPKRKV